MILRDLLEAARRDIYNQLNYIDIYNNYETGEKVVLQLTKHLDDDRDDGEARGDHVKPSEIISACRVGLKKLIARNGINSMLVDSTLAREQEDNKSICINFKLKSVQKIKIAGKTEKREMFSSIIGKLIKHRLTDEIYFKIITIYPPRTAMHNNKKARFLVNL